MGLGYSVESLGSTIVDERTVKEGLMLAVGYMALKGIYVSLTKSDLGGGGGGGAV